MSTCRTARAVGERGVMPWPSGRANPRRSKPRVRTCFPLTPRVLGGMMTASPLGSVGPDAEPCGIAGSSGALALPERSELVRARIGSVRWFVC